MKLILFVLISGCAAPAAAQLRIDETRLDSLEHVARGGDSYEARSDALGELSYYYSFPERDTVKALAYARQILEINRANNDFRGMGIAHFHMGGVFLEYDLDRAANAYARAEELLAADTSRKAKRYLARAWHNRGIIHQIREDEPAFLDILLNKTIPIREELGDTLRLGMDYAHVGLIFRNQTQYERALEYDERAIELLKNYPGYEALPSAYIEAAYSILFIEDEHDFTREGPLRKARAYLDEAARLLEPNPDSRSWLSFYEANGVYYADVVNGYEAALDNFVRGIALAQRLGDARMEMALRTQRHYVFMEVGDYQSARADMLVQYETFFDHLFLKDKVLVLKNLIAADQKLGNTEEMSRLYPQYATLLDSLRREESAVEISELERRFDSERSRREILERENQIGQQALALRTQLLWILGLAAAALLLGASVVIYRRRQRMARTEAELLGVKMERLEKEQELNMFSAMLEGQERERRRLAADLHDGLGGSLSGIRLKLSKLAEDRSSRTTAAAGALTDAIENLDDSVGELRRISRNLMPAALMKHGLEAALKDFCAGFESEKTRIVLQTFGLRDDVPAAASVVVYRIIQELVNNAVKHAGASEILAQVLQDGSQLSITVEDDGRGFDFEAVREEPGVGLSSVQSRVDYLKGVMDVTSEPGAGTSITVAVDLDDARLTTIDAPP